MTTATLPAAQTPLQATLEAWRMRWPEWTSIEVFVPPAERELAVAWFAVREELAHAAWGGSDPRPGQAKLAWWAEELRGWAQGRRRHPLGMALQARPVPWAALADCLPVLQECRDLPDDPEQAMRLLEPYAEAVAGIAQGLFGCQRPAPDKGVVLAQLAEHVLQQPAAPRSRDWARRIVSLWPPLADGGMPGRLHALMLRARLQRLAEGVAPVETPAWRLLLPAWRLARA